ncbi:MAG: IS1 family transposase [Cytophagales bacterium]|nr:IS1 family transposase [Cytophagales bacterium]
MNTMPIEKKVQILQLLVEGNSMRSIERIVGCSINTVTKLLEDAGAACAAYHDAKVRGLKSKRIECDEIWSFCYAKAKNVAAAIAAPEGAGDVWTWTAIDADSKLIISYLLGGRDAEYATEFMCDLKVRLANPVQLTTDGHRSYLEAVEKAFDWNVDYARLVKTYGAAPDSAKGRYSPADCTGIKKIKISGSPDLDKVSTSFVERQNLTMRMHMRRYTRLTNGFSKKLENQSHAVALHFMYYNFAKIHKSLRVTPAMEAGISDHVWSLKEISMLIPEPVAKKRGNYRPRQNAISN